MARYQILRRRRDHAPHERWEFVAHGARYDELEAMNKMAQLSGRYETLLIPV